MTWYNSALASLARFRGKVTWEEWAIIVVVAFVIVSDIFLALNNKEGDTYSEIFRTWSYQYAALPAFWGVLSGHWFFTLGTPRPHNGLLYLIIAGVILFLGDALTHSVISRATHPAMWFVFGLGLGSYFWSQTPSPL